MTRAEETLYLRMLQEADAATLEKYLTFEKEEVVEDGKRLYFSAKSDTDDAGFLRMIVQQDNAIYMAEMNVGFPTTIGLNRSPLELKILCEHVLTYHPALQ